MERFSYLRPKDVKEAVELLNHNSGKNYVLAGGTDLMLILKQDRTLSGRLVDITGISELHEIKCSGDTVTIGAAATFYEVMTSPVIRETAPVLAQAAATVGATQIRNMGTIGGNVANAAACADSIPALVCLDAAAIIQIAGEKLTMPVEELIVSPNRTKIPTGGLITAFTFKIPTSGSRSAFLKLGRRNAMAISRLTVAALGRLSEDNYIAEARFVTGSATPRICRLSAVENRLIGRLAEHRTIHEAAQVAVDEMIRLSGKRWSSEFKMPALAAMAEQVLADVFGIELVEQVAP